MTKGLLKNRLTKDAGAKDRRKVFCPCVCSNELLFCGNYLCTRGCLFNLLDCVLESLSGLEGRCLGRGDVDLGSGRGIPADVHDVFSPVVIYFSLGCDGIISKVSEFCNTASQTPSINVETLGDTLGGGTGTDSVIDAIIVWRA